MTPQREIPLGQKCIECGFNYRQDATGLCRRCAHIKGDLLTCQQRDKLHVEASAAKVKLLQHAARPPFQPRELEADGRTFDVVWDGTTPLVFD